MQDLQLPQALVFSVRVHVGQPESGCEEVHKGRWQLLAARQA